jgi:putative endonuclease
MSFFVYILNSEKFDKYYIGQTDDINNRLHRHNSGYEKATKPYLPWELVWHTEKPSRAEAMELEKKLKNLSKERIKAFIKKYQP